MRNNNRNQLAYNEPLSRLNAFGSGIASQASGSPTTTTNTTLGGAGTVGPLSQALSAGLSAYGLGSIFGGKIMYFKRPSFRRGGSTGIGQLTP